MGIDGEDLRIARCLEWNRHIDKFPSQRHSAQGDKSEGEREKEQTLHIPKIPHPRIPPHPTHLPLPIQPRNRRAPPRHLVPAHPADEFARVAVPRGEDDAVGGDGAAVVEEDAVCGELVDGAGVFELDLAGGE